MMNLIHDIAKKIIERGLLAAHQTFVDHAARYGLDEDVDVLIQRSLPHLFRGLRSYFRLRVEGMENIPRHGPAIIIANHSGVTAIDACVLAFEIFEKRKRIPRMVAHRLWFIESRLAQLVSKMGFVKADKNAADALLKKHNMLILFPEGEAGNFKPTSEAYHLREFKRGFVRLALRNRVPVILVAIVGAEEANINLKQFKLDTKLGKITIPLPLNIIPLPSKWHIRILPPLEWSVDPEFMLSEEDPRVRILAKQARRKIMREVHQMLIDRGGAYF